MSLSTSPVTSNKDYKNKTEENLIDPVAGKGLGQLDEGQIQLPKHLNDYLDDLFENKDNSDSLLNTNNDNDTQNNNDLMASYPAHLPSTSVFDGSLLLENGQNWNGIEHSSPELRVQMSSHGQHLALDDDKLHELELKHDPWNNSHDSDLVNMNIHLDPHAIFGMDNYSFTGFQFPTPEGDGDQENDMGAADDDGEQEEGCYYTQTVNTETGKKLFSCSICLKKVTTLMSIKNHMLRIHQIVVDKSTKLYICDSCSTPFVTKYHLKNHYNTHSNEDLPARCTNCELRFNSVENLELHIETEHNTNTNNKKLRKEGSEDNKTGVSEDLFDFLKNINASSRKKAPFVPKEYKMSDGTIFKEEKYLQIELRRCDEKESKEGGAGGGKGKGRGNGRKTLTGKRRISSNIINNPNLAEKGPISKKGKKTATSTATDIASIVRNTVVHLQKPKLSSLQSSSSTPLTQCCSHCEGLKLKYFPIYLNLDRMLSKLDEAEVEELNMQYTALAYQKICDKRVKKLNDSNTNVNNNNNDVSANTSANSQVQI